MEKTIQVLHGVGNKIDKVGRVLLGVLSIALTIVVAGQFILRWFGQSMNWASEFSCYIFVWTTMLGSAIASKYLLHIGVDAVTNCLHGTAKKIILIVGNLVLLVALILFVDAGIQYTISQATHMAATLNISIAWFYVSLPISGAIMIYYTIIQLLEVFYYGATTRLLLPGEMDNEEVVG